MTVKPPRQLVESPLITAIRNRKNFKEETRRVYLRAVDDFVRFAGTDPGQWTYATVEDWRDKLGDRGLELEPGQRRGGRPLGVHSTTVYLKALRFAAKRWAQRESRPDRVVLDFTAGVDVPAADATSGTKKRYAIPLTAAIAMLATCRGSGLVDLRDRALLTFGFRTGMRRRGLAGITLADFGQSQLGENIVWITLKGGRRHDVPLDDACLRAAGQWQAVLTHHGRRTGAFFWSLTDDEQHLQAALTPEDIYKIVIARAALAGVTSHVTPHVMRHSAISYMIAAGVPVYRIKRVTGQRTDDIIGLYTTELDVTPASSVLPTDLG